MALRLAPPVTANLLNYLWPLLILLFTPVFFRQVSLTKRQVIGAVISLMGAGLIVSGNGSAESREFSFEHLLGYSFAVLAAITWACYSLLTKKLTQEYNQFGSATVGLFCLLSSVLAMVVHYALEQSPVISSADIGLMFILGLGPLGLSFYCWDAALKKGDPRVIATLSYFTPLLSTLLLITVGGKNFNQEILLAMCLITFGALVANLDLRVLVRCYQGIFPEK